MPRRKRSYRRQARRITEGLDRPHFIGPMSSLAAEAMIFAITNTKEPFRNQVWGSNWRILLKGYKILSKA